MSFTVADAFNKFLKDEINFSGSEAEQAGKSQRFLREQLEEYAENNDHFFNFIDGDFLSGSFGRKTAIKPLNDVDVFMILDGANLMAISDGRYIPDKVEGSGDSYNPLSSGYYYGLNSLISSKKVINALANALKESIYPNSKVGKDGQAVNVWLESYELGLDVVPAFHLIPPGSDQDYYFIPAGDNREDWIETNPKIDAAILDSVGGVNISRLRDVIRMMRYWNQVTNNDRLSGYHVEVMTLRILENYDVKLRREAIVKVFEELPSLILEKCPSQTGFGENIDSYLSDEDRTASCKKAVRGQVISKLADEAEVKGDDKEAITFWKLLFGDKFPEE